MASPTLLRNVEIRQIGAPIANASNTNSNSTRIDMAGYEGVIFVCPIEDSANTGVATITARQHTLNQDSGMTNLVGATVSATSAADDDLNNKLLIIDVYQPRERYVQLNRTSATANIAFGTVTAILYGKKKLPVAAHSSVLAQVSSSSPSE